MIVNLFSLVRAAPGEPKPPREKTHIKHEAPANALPPGFDVSYDVGRNPVGVKRIASDTIAIFYVRFRDP